MKTPTASDAARSLGSLGASKGGKARAAKMTPAQRSASAQKASLARWAQRLCSIPGCKRPAFRCYGGHCSEHAKARAERRRP
jgi:hypothetical protein